MQLMILEATPELIKAGYACPCGCRPSVEYTRGAALVEEDCCCGNQFAIGPRAMAALAPRAGFRPEAQGFDSPWGERLEAAWLVGPSVHGPSMEHDDLEPARPEHGNAAEATDPVCGMSVGIDAARARGLHSAHQGRDYYFCGKGCRLEFDEDPARYLDPGYVPSM